MEATLNPPIYLAKILSIMFVASALLSFIFIEIDGYLVKLRTLLLDACVFNVILCASALLWSGVSIPSYQRVCILLATGTLVVLQFGLAALLH
jgi:hypothetical protein